MVIGILKEPSPDTRVLAIAAQVKKFVAEGNEVLIENGAGALAFQSDQMYQEAGGKITTKAEILEKSEMLFRLQALTDDEIRMLKPKTVLLGNYGPLFNKASLEPLAGTGITLFSLESIPRITRAQSMDILSSQSSLAGYKAVLTAAANLPRSFPMFMTAAGTIAPAKVLVIGAGVAGLQAIATAKRLGAVIEAFDTRPSVKEQVASVGGKFIEVPGAVEDKGAGGYAVEQSAEYKALQQEMLEKAIVKADVVITTAQIPGRKAPILIKKAQLDLMKPGAIIIDLAASTGGNTEGALDNEFVTINQVKIYGNSNLAATMPEDASKLLSNNLADFLKLILKKGELTLDFEDPIISGTCVMHGGELVFPAYKTNPS